MFFQQYFWLKADALHLALVHSKAAKDAVFTRRQSRLPPFWSQRRDRYLSEGLKFFFFFFWFFQSGLLEELLPPTAPQFLLTSNPSPNLILQRSSWKPRPVHSSSFRKKFNFHLAVISKAFSSVPRAPVCKLPFWFQPRCTPWLSETLHSSFGFCCSLCLECHCPHFGPLKPHLALKTYSSASSLLCGARHWPTLSLSLFIFKRRVQPKDGQKKRK